MRILTNNPFLLIFLLARISLAQVQEYPFKTNVVDNCSNIIGEISYKKIDLNHDGVNEKVFFLPSLIRYSSQSSNPGPLACTDFHVYKYNEKHHILLIIFGNKIFQEFFDQNNKFAGIFSNGKEIHDWTKAYTHDDDEESWIAKFNLGYYFKSLEIKNNKIYLLTNDGGSGSTGGFNIEHVFTIKNDKPITLVSRFIENEIKSRNIQREMRKK